MSEVLVGREPVSEAVRRRLIELVGVEKVYRAGKVEFPALRGVDLSIADGEMVAIVGPSGSGKSTIMNMITGIDRPTACSSARGRSGCCAAWAPAPATSAGSSRRRGWSG